MGWKRNISFRISLRWPIHIINSFDKTKVVFYWDQTFLVRWVDWVFSCSIWEKFVSVGLVDQLFQPASNQVETVEKALSWVYRVIVARIKDYSHELPRSNRKRLEKCSIEKRQPYQPKPVAVETVDPNRTWPKLSCNTLHRRNTTVSLETYPL